MHGETVKVNFGVALLRHCHYSPHHLHGVGTKANVLVDYELRRWKYRFGMTF